MKFQQPGKEPNYRRTINKTLISGLVMGVVLCLPVAAKQSDRQAESRGSQSISDTISIGQCGGSVRALQLLQPLSAQIQAGDVQCYRVLLGQDQFMHIVVMQQGVDV